MQMFEGLAERVSDLGGAIREWVDMDNERGNRFERVFKAIEVNSRYAAQVEYDHIVYSATIDTTGADGVLQLPVVPQGFVWEYTHIAAKATVGNPTGEVYIDNLYFIGDFALGRSIPMYHPLILTEGRNLAVRIEDSGAPSSTQITTILRRIPSKSRRLARSFADSDADFKSERRTSKAKLNFGFDAPVIDERGTANEAAKATPLTTEPRSE